MASTDWYYADKGASVGPISPEDLEQLVETGTVKETTLVWQEGMSDWIAFGQLIGEPAPPPPRRDPVPVRHFGFVAAVRDGLVRFFDFEGRSGRPQFWYFQLALVLSGFIAGVLDHSLGMGGRDFPPIGTLLSVLTFLPSLAVAIRRLHDTGRSGWWMFMIFLPVIGWLVLLYFYVLKSELQTNKWGDPV